MKTINLSSPRRAWILGGTLALALPATGCVMPDQMSQIQKDVADVQQKLRDIEREQQASRAKLDAIEADLQEDGESVGRVEFANLQDELRRVARDVAVIDERLNDANRRMDGLSQTVQETRAIAGRPPAAIEPSTTEDAEPGQPAPGTPAPVPTGQPTGAVPNPEELYNAAYADYSKGNYVLAISGFEEYATRFPDSDLADNALYWVGECHFSQGEFDRAVRSFDGLLASYPKSDRAAAADLKKALAYLEQNQIGLAIVQLQHVVKTYPSTDESRIARDKLASLGASGA